VWQGHCDSFCVFSVFSFFFFFFPFFCVFSYVLKQSPNAFHLVSLKATDRTFTAVRTILQKHTSSVAIFDEEKKKFLGFVDVLDLSTLVFLLAFTDSIKGVLSGREPSAEEFSKKEIKVLAEQKLGDLINLSTRDPWVEVPFQASAVKVLESLVPKVSLYALFLFLFLSLFQFSSEKGARRVTVLDAGNAGIEGIVSQWDAVRWLQRQIVAKHYFPDTRFADIVPQAVREKQRSRVVVVQDSATAMDAFTKLAEEEVSGAAVVDAELRLLIVLLFFLLC
jgi:CBS domain-containing protein